MQTFLNDSQNSKEIRFFNLLSFIFSIISLILVLFLYILFIKRKQLTEINIFSLQLSFSPLFNAISYLFPKQENDSSFSCKLQAMFHIFSILLIFNMMFIYFFVNYIKFSNSTLLHSQKSLYVIYTLNWILMFLMIGFHFLHKPTINTFYLCRYAISKKEGFVDATYCIVMMIFGFVFFFLIAKSIKKKINESSNQNIISLYENAVSYFFIMIAVIALNLLGYFLKVIRNNMIFELIDRILELVSCLFVLIFLLEIKGLKELLIMCKCLKEKESNEISIISSLGSHIIEGEISVDE